MWRQTYGYLSSCRASLLKIILLGDRHMYANNLPKVAATWKWNGQESNQRPLSCNSQVQCPNTIRPHKWRNFYNTNNALYLIHISCSQNRSLKITHCWLLHLESHSTLLLILCSVFHAHTYIQIYIVLKSCEQILGAHFHLLTLQWTSNCLVVQGCRKQNFCYAKLTKQTLPPFTIP